MNDIEKDSQNRPTRDSVREKGTDGGERISCALGGREFESDLARYIDHTALKPGTTRSEVRILCEEAVRYGFAAVCVNPCWVRYAVLSLEGCPVPVCTVAGFPLGANTTATKAHEAEEAFRLGAKEIDMVINLGELKSGQYDRVFEDIRAVVRASGEAKVKAIIETAYLNDMEKVAACVIVAEAGAAFVKTSTGFAPSGATVEDVALMRKAVGDAMGVKAAGGIRDRATARAMIEAGATRIGTSASVGIVRGV